MDFDKAVDKAVLSLIGIILTALCLFCVVSCFGPQKMKHIIKDLNSDITGLKRTVTVYDYNGNVLGEWNGKFTVKTSRSDTDFIVDDQRIIIRGGIVIIRENTK